MEGVLVSAKKDGSTITTTVVSDQQGAYSFPSARLEPGKYTISIRAVGYRLDGAKTVDVRGGRRGQGRSQAQQGQEPRAAALQWRMAAQPSRRRQAKGVSDHVRGLPHAAARPDLQPRCRRIPAGVPAHVALFARQHADPSAAAAARPARRARRSSPATPPRRRPNFWRASRWAIRRRSNIRSRRCRVPKGRSTKVVVTEYDLPRKDALPHDVVVDKDGQVWYSDFGAQFVGVIDPKTGKTKDIAIPVRAAGAAQGRARPRVRSRRQRLALDDVPGGISKIDRKTHEVTVFPFPKEWISTSAQASMVSPMYSNVDGKVWTNNQEDSLDYRLDLATGKFENPGQAKTPGGKQIRAYGMPTDHQNNLYQLEFGGQSIGRRDAKTLEVTIWPTATRAVAPAARAGRRAEPPVVRRIRRQRHRHVRSEDRRHQGVATAHALERALRRGRGQERSRGLDRLDAERPGVAARIPQPARSWTICCRARPTSGACSSTRPARGRCCGSAATTAPASSRWNRWTDCN